MSDEVTEEIGFVPLDHDIRIVRGDWIYWVRAVKRGTAFNRFLLNGGDPGVLLLLPLLLLIVWLWSLGQRRARWKVGVVRVPSPYGWKTGQRVIHKELLGKELPLSRLDSLADEVRAGKFDE